ncbi:hypothetical protein EVAR_36666_1 [Eumeta japonica]|uniref:Uncharacterized protein n=1 Tax=Eumeta variegata TaxID=151549 RepID=A0A4C1XVE2_EUMVA|nr:hypothetical protein EVAR_36666_1 [Eumeta japonica]
MFKESSSSTSVRNSKQDRNKNQDRETKAATSEERQYRHWDMQWKRLHPDQERGRERRRPLPNVNFTTAKLAKNS